MTTDRAAWARAIEHRTRSNLRIADAIRIGDPPLPAPRANKYGAIATTVDGIRFDSRKEATRYQDLKILQAAGVIANLELQPEYPLMVVELFRGGPPFVVRACGVYTADFRYLDNTTGEIVVEDTKSAPTKTKAYRLRKRIAEAIHGITVREL
jgi:hypothetical protein